MKNKTVGLLIIGISVLIGFIIYLFNRALTKIVNTSCSHGITCPMWGTINVQTGIGIGILVFVVAVGLYLVFFSKEEKIPEKTIIKEIKTVKQLNPKKITKESYSRIMEKLSGEEKKILGKVIESEGTIFQSDLVEKSGFTKVKVTRILDRLEGKGLIERKRRGMTNIVILK